MTPPLGFRFAATYAGIRKTAQDDLALMVSERPAAAAAVFTSNLVKAAPLTVSASYLAQSKGVARAIVANAGNANCATPNGVRVARATARAAAAALGVREREVLLASTGVIGVPLDERRIVDALPKLVAALAPEGFDAAARAILTTDTIPKTASAEVRLQGGTVRIAGMAKGAGMIHPLMATMLSFLFTDADLRPAELKPMLAAAVERSFNRISVDGDTSTNDTVYLIANGASGVRPLSKERARVEEALLQVAEQLAVAIVRDGEGARKLLTIAVEGASSDRAAATLARAIANSPLVKTALAGADPNWGRILSAAGNSGVAFDPAKVDLDWNGVRVCRRGTAADFSEDEVKRSLEERESVLRFAIRGKGKGRARFWTCDLTEEYIRINASYRT
ncbi:MAG: bifunctional glutamate N-acetyltransferase/amino-acid acetyltransferase ArgJ [Acidobacteria bacterium]|nr:bifunctional glutamate N-acetyltransferase/amino-acid acetyltransferase ArgJ [Acidobacteriota bacterium]